MERIWPRCTQSLEEMRAGSVRVQMVCDTCRTFTPLDPAGLESVFGGDACLIDARTTCRDPHCTGSCFFLYSTGRHTPFRPLRS